MTPHSLFTDIMANDDCNATAWISGNDYAPQLNGFVRFYNTPYQGILVIAEVFGLPDAKQEMATGATNNPAGNTNSANTTGFFAMHIHEYGDCTIPFDKTGSHYNPSNMEHPYHAGDLVPLLSNNGYAFLAFYDNRFTIDEIIGRSVIIHSNADDFVTQPSGNSGSKIGCGTIDKVCI